MRSANSLLTRFHNVAAVLAVAAIISVAGDAHAQANPWGGAKGAATPT